MTDWRDAIAKAVEQQNQDQSRKQSLEDELILADMKTGGDLVKGPFGDKLTKWFGEKGARKIDDIVHLLMGVNSVGRNMATGALNASPHEIMYAYKTAQLQQKRLQAQLSMENQRISNDSRALGMLKSRLNDPAAQFAFTALFSMANGGHRGAQAVSSLLAKIGPGLTDEGLNNLMMTMINHPTDVQALEDPNEALQWFGQNLAEANPRSFEEQKLIDTTMLRAKAGEIADDEARQSYNEALQAASMGMKLPPRKTRTAEEIFKELNATYEAKTSQERTQSRSVPGLATGVMGPGGNPMSFTDLAGELKKNAQTGAMNPNAIALDQFIRNPDNAIAVMTGDPVATNVFRSLYDKDHTTNPMKANAQEDSRRAEEAKVSENTATVMQKAIMQKQKFEDEKQQRKLQYETQRSVAAAKVELEKQRILRGEEKDTGIEKENLKHQHAIDLENLRAKHRAELKAQQKAAGVPEGAANVPQLPPIGEDVPTPEVTPSETTTSTAPSLGLGKMIMDKIQQYKNMSWKKPGATVKEDQDYGRIDEFVKGNEYLRRGW